MSDRKYRQHGYQDDGSRNRSPQVRRPPEPRDPRLPRDPKVPNMPGFRSAFRCARCGHAQGTEVGPASVCAKCGVPLRACIQCQSFDAGARFECNEPVPQRVSPKDAANACQMFAARISVERETGSTPVSGSNSARKAFDDLFKF